MNLNQKLHVLITKRLCLNCMILRLRFLNFQNEMCCWCYFRLVLALTGWKVLISCAWGTKRGENKFVWYLQILLWELHLMEMGRFLSTEAPMLELKLNLLRSVSEGNLINLHVSKCKQWGYYKCNLYHIRFWMAMTLMWHVSDTPSQGGWISMRTIIQIWLLVLLMTQWFSSGNKKHKVQSKKKHKVLFLSKHLHRKS